MQECYNLLLVVSCGSLGCGNNGEGEGEGVLHYRAI